MKRLFSLAAALALGAALSCPARAAGEEAAGRKLLNALGCKSCHRLEGVGGTLGPALDGVGKRLQQAQIEEKLRAPKASNPASIMPSFNHLPDKEIESLASYLAKLL